MSVCLLLNTKKIDLIEVSRPILEELANRSNMFIHLAILEDEKVVVISKIFPKARMQSTTQLMSQICGILPMHCTRIGLLFLSQHDDKYCREFLSRQPLDRYTTTTQTEIPQIMERIQNIRDLQYVINNGEHDEAANGNLKNEKNSAVRHRGGTGSAHS